jgi:hypothetical protein
MPRFPFSQALTANQVGFNPLTSWDFERLPWEAVCLLYINCTDANARITLRTGSQTIQQRSPVTAGGTAGVLPNELNVDPVVWKGSAGDKITIEIDEVAGGTPTVNGVIKVEPSYS